MKHMLTVTISEAAMEALTQLANEPGSAVDPVAYRELAAYDFVMAGAEAVHITQRGKTFWLRSQGESN